MPRRSGDGPLAELHPVRDVDPAAAVAAVEFDSDDEVDARLEGGGHPGRNGLEGEGVGV